MSKGRKNAVALKWLVLAVLLDRGASTVTEIAEVLGDMQFSCTRLSIANVCRELITMRLVKEEKAAGKEHVYVAV